MTLIGMVGCQGETVSEESTDPSSVGSADHSDERESGEIPPQEPSDHESTPAPRPARTGEAAPTEKLVAAEVPAHQANYAARERVLRLPVDDGRAAAKGIRRVDGKHLTLYTDLDPSQDVDELPEVFEKAVPQWCQYFGVPAADFDSWRLTCFLMRERQRFEASGLFPADLPSFGHGYQRGWEIWLYEQPSAYYRRHLLLHEGTHTFMEFCCGGIGPPWYAEGMAEMLAVHRWENGILETNRMPQSRGEVPFWGGRIATIQKMIAAGEGMHLDQVMQFGPTAHREPGPYAWSWAAAVFFDRHPRFQDAFRELLKQVRQDRSAFNQQLRQNLRSYWIEVQEQWQLFTSELQYGYDMERAAVQYGPGSSLPEQGERVSIAADRSWQSTGIRLEAGATYRITAGGRFQVADQPKPWWCEPGGITIHYYRGRPLGMLLAAVRNDGDPIPDQPHLLKYGPIGLSREFTPKWSGTLYLRINESPAGLADNAGHIQARIVRVR